MPEIRFVIAWPDGLQETCYSPSLVIKDFFQTGAAYSVPEFLERSRAALSVASDRVKAKYGVPCSLALAQITAIETAARRYAGCPDAQIAVLQFGAFP